MSRELSASDVVTVIRLWRLMVAFRPDIVHSHTSKAGAVGRIAGLLYRFVTPGTLVGRPRACRFVHTYHGHIFHSYYGRLQTWFFLAVDRVLARLNTDRLVVLGSQQLHEIRDVFRVGAPQQFVVVPLGLDLSIVGDAGRRAKPDQGRHITAGIVARLSPIKNHELFLQMAAGSSHCRRFFVFGDGPLHQVLEARAQELGVQDRVVFAGVKDAREIYETLDVVVLTSKNEGTPQTLIEAMAAGKVVVSTAVGGVVDLLGPVEEHVEIDGAAFDVRARGLTSAAGDAKGLTAALDRIATDLALRRRLASRGCVYAHETHGSERLLSGITQVYEELMSTPV
jgi:glycosyltransferase involved in cell wall biosynthesis